MQLLDEKEKTFAGGEDSVCIQEDYLPIPLRVNQAVQNQEFGPVL
jgi:hypothetical protein